MNNFMNIVFFVVVGSDCLHLQFSWMFINSLDEDTDEEDERHDFDEEDLGANNVTSFFRHTRATITTTQKKATNERSDNREYLQLDIFRSSIVFTTFTFINIIPC
jgi:hypothetical protein